MTPEALASWFAGQFGAPPELIWRAPGRVNLIGEHTDYNDGLVLPFAIGRGTLAAAAPRSDGVLELRSLQFPADVAAVPLDRLEPGAVTGWAAYPAGAVWAWRDWARQAGQPACGGVTVVVDSDVPPGAGLASSAALTCAVVSCLAAGSGPPLPSRKEIAAIARRAESDFAGMPCGIMDQSVAMLGKTGHGLLLDCRSGESRLVALGTGELQIVVVDTGVRHALADGRYAARRRECERAAELLGSPLRDIASTDGLAGPGPLMRRARHVVSENQRVQRVAELLTAGRLADCGELLTQSHQSLRDDFEVSWAAADAAVDAALAAGALGARMTGGGFGGCVLALVPAGRVSVLGARVLAALSGLAELPPAVLAVRPAAGARPAWPVRTRSRPG